MEAQRTAIQCHLDIGQAKLLAEYVEVETGANSDRPVLRDAIAECRRRKATLLIAKLDRLARSVAFISSLMEAGVEFVAVDAPYANRFMLHIMAAFAEHEREVISARTKGALAAAKARGVSLGTNGALLAAAHRREATAFAEALRPKVVQLIASGHVTLASIADGLNTNDVPSRENGRWSPMMVSRILARLRLNPKSITAS